MLWGCQKNQPVASAKPRADLIWRRLATLTAVFAILLQTLVVQTHVHGFGEGYTGASFVGALNGVVPAVQSEGLRAPADAQSECILCQMLATTGATILSASPALTTAAFLTPNAARPEIRLVPETPAHAWQSRAPPIVL